VAWPEGIPAWLKNQWGVLSGQVSARATTAELINSLRPYAEAAPEGWGPRGVIYVSQLRSMAVAIRTSSEAITRDGMTGTILAEHISEAPWARSLIQQSLAPRFMIRALVSHANPEALAGVAGVPEQLQQWVTHYPSSLPGTLDELVQQIIAQNAESGSIPVPVIAVNQIEILRE
jgi:hypothetical protein